MIQQLGKMNDTEKKGDNQVKKKWSLRELGEGNRIQSTSKGIAFCCYRKEKRENS